MSSSAERWACDTSLAIAALDPTHRGHEPARAALVQRRPALAGHAAFETYAVLTRLPPRLRLSPRQATSVISRAFPAWCWPDRAAVDNLRDRFADLGLAGGSVYDGLVAVAALSDQRILITRDKRARRTYELVGAEFDFVG